MTHYEIKAINGHVLINTLIKYHVSWEWYPPNAATLVTVDCLDGCKDLLNDYHKSVGVLDDNGHVNLQKLRDSAAKTTPVIHRCWVTAIKGHKNEKGRILYETEFEDGSVIFRPEKTFKENDEPKILKAYKEKTFHQSTPMPGTRTNASRASTSGRPTTAHRRGISIAPPAIRRAIADSSEAQDRPGPSHKPVTPKTGYKRAASVKAPLVDKRPRIVDNMGQKKVLNIFKNKEGKGEVLFEDGNGVLSKMDIDAAYQENPQEMFTALRDAFLAKD